MVAKRLGGYMSWVAECLFFSEVSKCLGDIMSGWQTVSVTQCLGVKMSVHQNVGVKVLGCKNFSSAKSQVSKCRRTAVLSQSPNLPYSKGVGSPVAAFPI